MTRKTFTATSFLTVLFIIQLNAAEYFVGKQGNDGNDGSSREKAFLTVQKGVDALKPGDTLTILPGEYLGSVRRAGLGTNDAVTTIRAEIPGTVLLRGDVPAPVFRKADGYKFVYIAEFDGDPQAVKEIETLNIMEMKPSVVELDFNPGSFCYDAKRKKLYISSTDFLPPTLHNYSLCVMPRSGLLLDRPRRVVVEGLAATGFYGAGVKSFNHGIDYVWGFSLYFPVNCRISDCTAYLNAGGICIDRGQSNSVERCIAYGNSSRYQENGGAIIAFSPCGDEIRDSLAFLNKHKGIEFYLTGGFHGRLFNDIAWGNMMANIQMKGGDIYVAERCVGLGSWAREVRFHYIYNCLIGSIPKENEFEGRRRGNIVLDEEARLDPKIEFADPDHMDYRLQETSRFRSTGPGGTDRGPYQFMTNVFFVRPDGNDGDNGLSVQHAWKTLARSLGGLKNGCTLYIEGGTYRADLTQTWGRANAGPIHVRGRGRSDVIVQGTLVLSGSADVTFERLHFTGPLQVETSRAIAFDNCTFQDSKSPMLGRQADFLKLTHCIFPTSAPVFQSCSNVWLSGNILPGPVKFDRSTVSYANYNAYPDERRCWILDGAELSMKNLQGQHERYSTIAALEVELSNSVPRVRNASAFASGGPNGTGLGLFSFSEFGKPELRLVGPFVHSVGDTTANIEWWVSMPAMCEIAWGETPSCEQTVTIHSEYWGGYSLSGLKPGKTYYCTIRSINPLNHMNPFGISLLKPDTTRVSFVTAVKPGASRRFCVAPDGNDINTGLTRNEAWQTINRAANAVQPGDTVLLAGGVYKETVRLRATGTPDNPITFKSIPGEHVVFDGDDRTLRAAFIVTGKNNIHFDGLYFRRFGHDDGTAYLRQGLGVLTLIKSDNISITRCLMDGRWISYSPPFISALGCSNLVVKNCVINTGMTNMRIEGSPRLRLENNVFMRPMIFQCVISGGPTYVYHNIFTDNIPGKEGVPLFELSGAASIDFKDNCFYLRAPDNVRKQKVFRLLGDKEFGDTPLTRLATVAQYDMKAGPSDTIFCDPQFAGARDINASGQDKTPAYYTVDSFAKSAHLRVTPADELDFCDYFANNPEVVKRGIGLQPEAFRDFKFITTGKE